MTNDNKDRNVSFDLMRTIIIVNSIFLHFHTKYNIGIFAEPFKFVQYHLFTVGAFFFFTSGVMANKYYIEQFKQNPNATTIHLLVKGFKLLSIYIIYLTIMRISTSTPFPDSVFSFLFQHPFFMTVLLTFGCIFLLSPILLFICTKYSWASICSVFFLYGMIAIGIFLNIDDSLSMFFFDREMMNYPLFPSLIIYFFGFIFAATYESYLLRRMSWIIKICFILMIVYVIIVIFNEMLFHNYLLEQMLWYKHRYLSPIRESLIICSSIILCVNLLKRFPNACNILNKQSIIVMGKESLTAYVFGNIFLNLLSPSDSNFQKIVLLITIISITHMICAWKLGNKTARGKMN